MYMKPLAIVGVQVVGVQMVIITRFMDMVMLEAAMRKLADHARDARGVNSGQVVGGIMELDTALDALLVQVGRMYRLVAPPLQIQHVPLVLQIIFVSMVVSLHVVGVVLEQELSLHVPALQTLRVLIV